LSASSSGDTDCCDAEVLSNVSASAVCADGSVTITVTKTFKTVRFKCCDGVSHATQ
jgi:hypothetical protein